MLAWKIVLCYLAASLVTLTYDAVGMGQLHPGAHPVPGTGPYLVGLLLVLLGGPVLQSIGVAVNWSELQSTCGTVWCAFNALFPVALGWGTFVALTISVVRRNKKEGAPKNRSSAKS
jgi:hypothetical protein